MTELIESTPIADSPEALQSYEITEGLLSLAEWACTLGSTGPAERQRAYERLCYPNDPPGPMVEATADKQYSCGLVQLGLLYLTGYRGPEVLHTIVSHLRGGGALAALERLARSEGVWNSTPMPPEVGEIWIIGSGGNDSHALLVLSVNDQGEGTYLVDSCDGGQPEPGGMGCRRRRRQFRGGQWRAVDGNHQPIPGNGSRGTYGYFDPCDLPGARFTGPRTIMVLLATLTITGQKEAPCWVRVGGWVQVPAWCSLAAMNNAIW